MNIDVQQCFEQAKKAEEQHQWSDAIEQYRKILEVFPNNQIAKEKLAWCLSRDKKYDEAISVLQDLQKSQPNVAKWPYMIGYQYYEIKNWQEAIKWYEKALTLNPNYIVVLYRKGYAHTQLEQVGQALKAFTHCRKLWHALPDSPQKQDDKDNCAKAAYHQAKVVLDYTDKLVPGAIEEAVPLLKEATQLDPNDHDKHYLLGKAFLAIGQPEQALSAFQEANRLKPNQDYVLDKWAEAFARLNRLEEALKLYERIPTYLRKGYTLRNQGHLYYRVGNYIQAEETLQQAVRKDARNHNGHYLLGLCSCKTGKLSQAKKELQEAIRLKQKHWNKPFPEAQKVLDELLIQHSKIAIEPLKSGRQVGTVITYKDDKGFGFIERNIGGQVFFHISNCRDKEHIGENVHVEFEEEMSPKGPRAIRVTCMV